MLVAACMVVATLALAQPGVRATLEPGGARVVLDGQWANAYYSVTRGERPDLQDVALTGGYTLCTGECSAFDPGALEGATYYYRFDVVTPGGDRLRLGPFAVSIGRPVAGFSVRALPNPMRAGGIVRVTAATAGASRPTLLRGEVALYDVRGRLVRRLFRGTLDRLTFDVAWDGRDEVGRLEPPGIYFLALRAGATTAVSRLVVER